MFLSIFLLILFVKLIWPLCPFIYMSKTQSFTPSSMHAFVYLWLICLLQYFKNVYCVFIINGALPHKKIFIQNISYIEYHLHIFPSFPLRPLTLVPFAPPDSFFFYIHVIYVGMILCSKLGAT